ncbi:hypothetical protein [Paractinoplanes globisporus]|jgi:uncharacterized membrane protein HdeD (DUF308 family)|uniref:DUF308 domain-containing protein n=1 Tax=Paractinoplanes globisporus TaxID=113565 RepID=A0ABW6WJH2_9ACTN|nr:hypothetical protein [Actinoplanes globisporus]
MTVVRDSMWGFLLFAGVAWLAIAWSVLRLEPVDVAQVAGPVVLFGALCEAVRALAGTRTWWLNAGMSALFAATAALLLLDQDSTYATPASLVGWFLMVRGAMDVAVSTMNRGADRTWGLMLALGVAQAALGFYASGPLARAADPMILLLGGLGVLRAVADLITALRLREVSVRHEVLHLTPEREAGVAGYSAGLTDFEPGQPGQPARAKHRADAPGPKTFHEEVLRSTKDLDAKIAQAGVTGTGAAANRVPEDLPPVPDTPAAAAEAAMGEDKHH